MFLSSVVVLLMTAAQARGDSGPAALYQAWCSKCHGADGRGRAAAGTRLAVPPAALQECAARTAAPAARRTGSATGRRATVRCALRVAAAARRPRAVSACRGVRYG